MKLDRDSIYILISNIYSKGMAYIFYFITALILGTRSFGVLKGLMPIVDTLTIFFSSGIPPAVAKFLAEEDIKDIRKYIPVLYLMILLSFIGFLITPYIKYILGGYYLSLPDTIYYVVGFCIISSTLISFSRGVLQGLLKIKHLSYTWIIESTTKIILVFILTWYFGILGSLISISISYLISGLYGGFIIYKFSFSSVKKYKFKLKSLNIRSVIKSNDNQNLYEIGIKDILLKDIFSDIPVKILKYSIPIALTSSSYRLFGDIDNIVIMSILGGFWSGIYGYSSLISRGIFMFASAVSIPLLPKISKTRDISILKNGIIQTTLFSSVFLAVCIFFPNMVLTTLFKTANSQGILSLRILAISSLFMSYYTLISSALQGLGYAKVSLYIIIIGVLLNLILNLILVKTYGIVGGSLSTLITSIILFIFGIFAILRIKKHIT